MNRSSLISAVNMGLRRAADRKIPAADAVADCIELALEMERTMSRASNGQAPDNVTAIPQPSPETFPLPPNPESLAAARIALDPTAMPPAEDPDAAPEPASLIVAGTHENFQQEIQRRETTPAPLRVKKLFLGNKLRVNLKDVTAWANASFPRVIKVTPRGMDQEIDLVLSVMPMPMTGGLEKDCTIKIVYENEHIKDLPVGVAMSVGDVQESYPEVEEILDKIRRQAVESYKARPKQIIGRADNSPDLNGQFGTTMRMIKDPKARAAAAKQEITFIDDTDERLMRR